MSPEEHPAMFDAELDSSGQKYTPHQDIIPMLPILPLIEREPRHKEISSKISDKSKGCVYARGLALYPNSPTVKVRRAELQQGTGQETDLDGGNHSQSAHPMPAVHPGGPDDRENRQPTPFSKDGSSVSRHSPEAGSSGYPKNQFQLGDNPATATEEQTSRFQRADSHTTRSRSSAGSLNNEESQSTATPPTEGIPDWSGSSGTIPPILETW
ncbi:hypothetical protein MMC30_008661 [Trapelia coarctata]|nr:hypothetical protein [Trapelia coarctata]